MSSILPIHMVKKIARYLDADDLINWAIAGGLDVVSALIMLQGKIRKMKAAHDVFREQVFESLSNINEDLYDSYRSEGYAYCDCGRIECRGELSGDCVLCGEYVCGQCDRGQLKHMTDPEYGDEGLACNDCRKDIWKRKMNANKILV